ncbi:MAG: ABC transporter permease [Burkholderiales bacterium]
MILSVARKELKTLFASPLAWIILAVVQFLLGYLFLKQVDTYVQFQAQAMRIPGFRGATEMVGLLVFNVYSMLFFVLVPLLGMRLIAEEKRNQTMTFLVSSPLSMTEIVLGKFMGLWLFLLLLVAITTLMPLSLLAGGTVDLGRIAAAFIGLVLMAASLSAVSLYLSSLTVHPIVAGITAFCALLGLAVIGETLAEVLRGAQWPAAKGLVPLAQALSPLRALESFLAGTIDSFSVAAPLLLTAFFLTLTVRRLDAARLRG